MTMRATRFPLRLEVRYRPLGKPDWQQGQTENISHSGALFRADAPLPVDTRVEFRLVLSTSAAVDTPLLPIGRRQHPEVAGLGRVVRTVDPTESFPNSGFALAIEQYEFLPPPRANSPEFAEDLR
jgi:hypothetical protein